MIEEIIDRIHDTLTSQDFEDFNDGELQDYITGDFEYDNALTPEQATKKIKERIKEIFMLEKFNGCS